MIYEHEEELNKFTAACEEVMTCNFIVAEIKIMRLLQCIAENEAILKEIGSSLKGFNYEFELQKCKVPSDSDRYELVLPVEATKKVALIFRILYDVDAKNVDLQKFINDYFVTDNDPYASYKNFCEKMIRPFMENVVYLLTGIDLIEKEPVAPYAGDLEVSDRCLVDIVEILKKLNKVLADESIKPSYREEGKIVINGFANALLTKNPETVLVGWIGFKNTLKEIKKAIPYLKKIEENLKESGMFSKETK